MQETESAFEVPKQDKRCFEKKKKKIFDSLEKNYSWVFLGNIFGDVTISRVSVLVWCVIY